MSTNLPPTSEKKVFVKRAKHDKEHPYVMISKSMFRDSNLSLKAKGALGYLLTLPDDWFLHPKQIASTLQIGRDQMYSILKELIENGYCKVNVSRGENNEFSNYYYEVSEDPIFKKCLPRPGFPDTGNPDTENPDTTDNRSCTDDIKKRYIPEASASKKKNSSFSEEVQETTSAIIGLLKKDKPDYKPCSFNTIAKSVDALIRIDGRKPSRILEIVLWAISNSFWNPLIFKPNPGNFIRKNFDTIDKLMKPNAQTKTQFDEWKKFQHGNKYSGYEFFYTGDKICFSRTTGVGHNEYWLKLNDPNLENNFFTLLNSLDIEIPKN